MSIIEKDLGSGGVQISSSVKRATDANYYTIDASLPKISIVITCYNYSRYIEKAISSVQKQTYGNFECLIVDDCSTDDSFAVATRYLSSINDDRFRSIRLGKNLGQMGAIAAGLENISGVFVVLMDADDLLSEAFIQTHLEVHLNTSYSAGISASDTYQIDENGVLLESNFHMLSKVRSLSPEDAQIKKIPQRAVGAIVQANKIVFEEPEPDSSYRYIERELNGWNVVAMSSFMFRRDILELIKPSNPQDLRICADFYLATFSHKVSGTLTIAKPLSAFRMHRNNNFSKNPVLGGRHLPGHFPEHQIRFIYKQISLHVINNFENLESKVGLWTCKELIEMGILPEELPKLLQGTSCIKLFPELLGADPNSTKKDPEDHALLGNSHQEYKYHSAASASDELASRPREKSRMMKLLFRRRQ